MSFVCNEKKHAHMVIKSNEITFATKFATSVVFLQRNECHDEYILNHILHLWFIAAFQILHFRTAQCLLFISNITYSHIDAVNGY